MVPLLAQRGVDLLRKLDGDKTVLGGSGEKLNNGSVSRLESEACGS